MDLLGPSPSSLILSLMPLFLLCITGVGSTTFSFVNRCEYTVWPGILPNAGSPSLDTTGFELPKDSSRAFMAPAGWSGRFWGRTGCNFDGSESGYCATADCGSGQVECGGAGATPPVTLAEFTLGTGGQDFYDVSLVDGYNLPMIVEGTGGTGMCASTGCVTDLNRVCPSELKYGDGEACRSACEAFGSPQYCCSGAYNSPATCKPSVYSEMFKSACPRSYSYAYDDPTSTFTCSGADYTVTFCPSMPSQKSSKDPPPTATTPATPANGDGAMTGSGTYGSGSGEGEVGMRSGPGILGTLGSGEVGSYQGTIGSTPGTMGTGTVTGTGGDAVLADGSWLAGLAMGDSTRNLSPSALHSAVAALTMLVLFLYF